MSSGTLASFLQRFVVMLKDVRLWVVVFPFLLIVSLIILFFTPQIATMLTFAVGLIASAVINQLNTLPIIDDFSPVKRFRTNIVIPALTGILLIPAPEVLTRIWDMFWQLFHKSGDVPSCGFLLAGSAWGWLGFLICGALLAVLTKERALFAATVGVAVYIPLSFTENWGVAFAQKSLNLIASSCKFDTEDADLGSFRLGMAAGLVIRSMLAIFAAKFVSAWQSSNKSD
jgi:hypothetical protein